MIGDLSIGGWALLAPMAGMTDRSFRTVCRDLGAALAYTELVSANSVLEAGANMWRLLDLGPEERPVGVQLFGDDPVRLAEAAVRVMEDVGPELIDLNMGCPVKKVVTKGAGAALMRDVPLVERLVRAVVDAVEVPVTAKTRSGWDDSNINAVEVAQAVEAAGGKAIGIHARTREQRHEGRVNLELLAEAKRSVGIPVIGNGGIMRAEDALVMKERTGVDAVMLARGAIGNPWIFSEIDALIDGRLYQRPPWPERRRVIVRHLDSVLADFAKNHRRDHEAAACSFVRGHLINYARELPGFPGFRRSLSELCDRGAIFAALDRAASPVVVGTRSPTCKFPVSSL